METEGWLRLGAFMALVCGVALYGLAAAGHFPREHRAPSLRSPAGAALLFGTMGFVAVAALVGVSLAARSLPWFAAIIGAGLILLATPLLLRPFSDDFVNGGAALVTLAVVAVICAALLAFV